MSSISLFGKAIDVPVRQNSRVVQACGLCMKKVRNAVIGQVLFSVTAKMILTLIWLTSILLRLSQKIACSFFLEKVISKQVSLVSANVQA